ncbi:SDR family oxidoreductase [Chitinophaga sp. Cy-1792]|uniref:SDR family oxidoreductase n=1 Tax=Chitinophaga sp. Cy-1792 TaxID=2608339 RepID=UPI001420B7FB|nr:SDR family oxidoreductase [Chitinophaga sp. Cy-1792]NIG56192.1 SDR family oxidoreductase [Chitinophaga sp. Cy-1792]
MPSVLILGAGSDMAVAIARAYASRKYDLQLAARSGQALIPLQQDLQIRHSVNVTVHDFDATAFNSHAAFYEQLPVIPDISICVFGYLGDQEKAETNWLEAERIINSNYTGAVSILNIIAERYITKGSGTIIGISSVAGERGRMSNYIYGSAKAGFSAYLSGLRNRLFHKGIHVMSVQPGFVNTQMTQHLALPPLLTAQPEAVAAAVLKAADKKKNTLFVKWHWKYIMLIIRNIPEGMFKKLKL